MKGSVWWLAAWLALGCSGKTSDAPGAGGAGGASGGSVNQVAGAPSSAGAAIAGGGTDSAGTDSGGGDAAGASPIGGSSAAGTGGGDSIPRPSAGCGKDPAQAKDQLVKFTIATAGSKEPSAADSKTGPWAYTREYYVWLPADYDATRVYPLVIQAAGCGSDGTDVYALSPANDGAGTGVNGSVIRVALAPPPNEIGHVIAPDQGCFDDREGDDSVEWPFYEGVLDALRTRLCFDEQRVFATGNSSGAWLANELACKYAGDTKGHAIRGIASNGGGLPTQAQYAPTCTGKPFAALWIDTGNPVNSYPSSSAIQLALKANGCEASSLDVAKSESFPVSGQPDANCLKVLGCPTEYPLVVCRAKSPGANVLPSVASPVFAAFLQSLAKAH